MPRELESGALTPYQLALAHVLAAASPLALEELPLESAVTRIAAADVTSILPSPPFCNSSVDGFALVAADLQSTLRLDVTGRLCAGDSGDGVRPLRASAVEITTGAPIPNGFDAVVKVEEVAIERDASGRPTAITLSRPVPVGENLRFTGEDFASGEVLLPAGTRITPQHVMALAASGVGRLSVRAQARVALLSTGQEVVDIRRGRAHVGSDVQLPMGKLYNSTAPFIVSALESMGAKVNYYGIVTDSRDDFQTTFRRIVSDSPDLVITTGAVSVGLTDFVPSALAELGAEIQFHRVAIRPARPLLFARLPRAGAAPLAIFGFPGNQISSVVGFRFFVAPFIRRAAGSPEEAGFRAQMSAAFTKPENLTTFCLGRLSLDGEVPRFAPWPRQMSFMLGPILHSNAWAVLPAGRASFGAGEMISCHWLYPSDYDYA